MRRRGLPGFTLVELLVVITIIAVLVALLLPAIQMARESGRRAQCTNQMKQIATACLQHEQAQGFLPTGGWGAQWAGDPAQGYSPNQPGGWMFNILPYMDQQALHDLGLPANGAPPSSMSGMGATQSTPVATFICPSRRLAKAYPYNPVTPAFTKFNNTNMAPILTTSDQGIGRSDYAANGGGICNSCWTMPGSPTAGLKTMYGGPPDLATGQSWSPAQWKAACWDADGSPTPGQLSPYYGANGTMYIHSRVQMVQIVDGPSKTYLFGERYINPDNYTTGAACGDNGGWDMGYDYNTTRWASLYTYVDINSSGAALTNGYYGSVNGVEYLKNGMPTSYIIPPMRDTAGMDYTNISPVPPVWTGQTGQQAQAHCDTNFGSAHPTAFNMAFCDGSVHSMSYATDLTTHVMLAQRADKNSIDPTKWQASAASPATTVIGSLAP